MKLTTEDTKSLQSVLATCSIVGIDAVIIEDGVIRGANESKTAAIISSTNVPKFTQRIGISRLSSLKQRLDLFAGSTGAVIDARETERGEISTLEISAGRNKAQFRCTSSVLIKAPKQINDEASVKVYLAKDECKMLLDATRVMGAKKVVLCVRPDGHVEFEVSDATNDSFKIELATAAERLDDETGTQVFYYPADVFSAGLRSSSADNDTTTLQVGQIGTIKLVINGHSVTLLPQINEDSEED